MENNNLNSLLQLPGLGAAAPMAGQAPQANPMAALAPSLGGGNMLANLGMLLLSNMNQMQNQPIETANVGGTNLLVNRPGGGMRQAGQMMQGLGQSFLMMQKMQKLQDFKKNVDTIMGTDYGSDETKAIKERKQTLATFFMKNPELSREIMGDDGFNAVTKDYLEGENTKEWKPATKEEVLSLERAKYGIKEEAEAGKRATQEEKEMLKRATDLRKEFNSSQITKDYNTISRAAKGMESAFRLATDPNKKTRIASDQALGVLFQKLLDPQSVVRESEYARTPEGASLLNRLQSIAPQMAKGGLKLKDDDRMALLEMSRKLLESAQETFNMQIDRYTGIAKKYEVDPSLIFDNIKKMEVKSNSGFEMFNVGGKSYRIPSNEVEAFKKDMGL